MSIDPNCVLNRLKASTDKPEQALLAIFELLSEPTNEEQTVKSLEVERTALLAHITQQGKKAGLQAPELLAQQIYYMASNAFAQQQANTNSNALFHAKQAASALIKAQREPAWLVSTKQYLRIKPVQYGLAISLFAFALIGMLMGYQSFHSHVATELMPLAEAASQTTNRDITMASPAETAEMYATIEKMRDGRCHYIEALQLPTSQQGLYLQNVIAGQISSNAVDQKTARELINKVSCDYTPMLMKNSRG